MNVLISKESYLLTSRSANLPLRPNSSELLGGVAAGEVQALLRAAEILHRELRVVRDGGAPRAPPGGHLAHLAVVRWAAGRG